MLQDADRLLVSFSFRATRPCEVSVFWDVEDVKTRLVPGPYVLPPSTRTAFDKGLSQEFTSAPSDGLMLSSVPASILFSPEAGRFPLVVRSARQPSPLPRHPVPRHSVSATVSKCLFTPKIRLPTQILWRRVCGAGLRRLLLAPRASRSDVRLAQYIRRAAQSDGIAEGVQILLTGAGRSFLSRGTGAHGDHQAQHAHLQQRAADATRVHIADMGAGADHVRLPHRELQW